MIAKETLHPEWINQASTQNRNADKILLEKVIRSLLLLEGLSESGLSFIFKGGTAVMLLQGLPKRFSIDIDIIVPDRTDFETYFNKFMTTKGFTRIELQERKTLLEIEKIHYKFFYIPIHRSNINEDNILLDILVESSKYRKVLSVNIDSPFVKQENTPLKVNIPSVDDIFGDKLTAFAPNT
jgi:predicted nucleotidyltransferase component of viral defense system